MNDLCPESTAKVTTDFTAIDPVLVIRLMNRALMEQFEDLGAPFGMDKINDSLKRIISHAYPNHEVLTESTPIARNNISFAHRNPLHQMETDQLTDVELVCPKRNRCDLNGADFLGDEILGIEGLSTIEGMDVKKIIDSAIADAVRKILHDKKFVAYVTKPPSLDNQSWMPGAFCAPFTPHLPALPAPPQYPHLCFN